MDRRPVTAICLLMLACETRDRTALGADAMIADRHSPDLGVAADATTDTDASPLADAGSMTDASAPSDGGPLPDTGADAGAPISSRLFITSDRFDGDLMARAAGAADGPTAGDILCRGVAARANLGGDWGAWLSSDTVDAIDRLHERGPWHDLQGTLVFESLAQIPAGPQTALWYDEASRFLATDRIWTGTIFDGTRGPMVATCTSWSSGAMSDSARIGQVGRTGGDWTFQTMTSCDQQAHLICFEQ